MNGTPLYSALVHAGICRPTYLWATGTYMSFRAFIGSGQRSNAAAILFAMHNKPAKND